MSIISLSGQSSFMQSGATRSGEAGQKATLSQDKVRAVTEMVNRDYHTGKFDLFDPSICLNYDSADVEEADPALEGKAVIQNKPTGWIITTIDPNVTTADDARKSAKAGGATHAFLYQSFDFLDGCSKGIRHLGRK